jgi:hypothetical protein
VDAIICRVQMVSGQRGFDAGLRGSLMACCSGNPILAVDRLKISPALSSRIGPISGLIAQEGGGSTG